MFFCYFDMKNEKGAEMFCVNLSDARGKWIVNTKHIASLPRLTADHLPFATHCQVNIQHFMFAESAELKIDK